MKALDILVRDFTGRSPVCAPNVEMELVNVNFGKATSKLLRERYDVFIAPGNSFGHMTGGLDQGIIEIFDGWDVQDRVLDMISNKYKGMMPVGQAQVVMISDDQAVVYVPTMMVPTKFVGVTDPYMLAHSALRAIEWFEMENQITFKRGIMPLFGTGTGGQDVDITFKQQCTAILEHYLSQNGKWLGCKDLFDDGTERHQALFNPNFTI